MKITRILTTVFAWLMAASCLAAVVSSVSVPPTRNTGDVITAAIWNSDVGSVYAYLNNTIAPVLNVLHNKGDIYVYDGANLVRQGVGSDGQVLTADHTQTNGIKWAAFADTTPLTTKGDLLGFSTTAARVPVGADGKVLTADSTQALGVKWATSTSSLPSGTILAWSPSYAGTNTIPTGWLLCNGTSGTPNLIGRFVVGAKPSTSSATGASGSYGNYNADSGHGSTSHTHTTPTSSATSSAPSASVGIGSGNTVGAATSVHTHTFAYGGQTTSAASTEPADYALCYIMKQ